MYPLRLKYQAILVVLMSIIVILKYQFTSDIQIIKSKKWYELLPDCPCESPDKHNVILNDGWAKDAGDINYYHSGANLCIRSYPPTTTIHGKSGQQCCYDLNNKLITSGTGAGTPDMVSTCDGEDNKGEMATRILGLIGHWKKDVLPWEKAGGKTNGWVKYNQTHPPNNDNECITNIVEK